MGMLYKNYLLLIFLLLFSPLLTAQISKDEREVTHELRDLLFDTGKYKSLRKITTIDLSGAEKEAFLKDFDKLVADYNNLLLQLIEEKYTVSEMKELLAFLKTPLGLKLSHDIRLIEQNSLPPGNSLADRTKVLKEKYK